MPLRLDEVGPDLDHRNHTIGNAIARMESLGEDPLRKSIDERVDLPAVLAKLTEVWTSR
jgi:hypothetical protein